MNCSPSFRGEPRQYVSNPCNHNCFYWEACLKELKLPKDYKNRVWIEIPATEEEIKNGTAHINRKYSENSFKTKKIYKKWRVLSD